MLYMLLYMRIGDVTIVHDHRSRYESISHSSYDPQPDTPRSSFFLLIFAVHIQARYYSTSSNFSSLRVFITRVLCKVILLSSYGKEVVRLLVE